MSSKMKEVVKKAKTLNCVLCRGLVAYTKENRERFDSHMAIEHGISENLNYILAGCLMNQDERDVVADIINKRERTGRGQEREGTSLCSTNGEEVTEDDDIESARVEKKEAGKLMECEECDEKFTERRSLWLHRKSNHGQVKKEEPKRKRLSGVKKEDEPVKKKGKKDDEQEAGDEDDNDSTLNEEVANRVEEGHPEGVDSMSKSTNRKLRKASKEMEELVKDEEENGEMKHLEEEGNIRELFPSPSVKKGKKKPKPGKIPKVEDSEEAGKSDGAGPDVDSKQVERQRVLKESEYFGSHPNEVTIFTSKEKDIIKEDEFLPPDWTAVERATISGRKIISFVNPDKVLSFRSRVGVFEFLKFSGLHSEAELEIFSKMVKTRKSI